jgi:XTP/dITP diphosphohydrolase
MAALLAALNDRTRGPPFPARFRCALALVDPRSHGSEAWTVEGVCHGTITRTPRGANGFGYDPIFVVDGTDKTMAELTPEEKSCVSHRGRAFDALRPLLARLLERQRQ